MVDETKYFLILIIFSNANKDGTIKENELTIEELNSRLSLLQKQKEIHEFQIMVKLEYR